MPRPGTVRATRSEPGILDRRVDFCLLALLKKTLRSKSLPGHYRRLLHPMRHGKQSNLMPCCRIKQSDLLVKNPAIELSTMVALDWASLRTT